ncbi:hypothetical protein [Lactiplantibacillus herbarum]|uniref:hypothetical protein n=1 Tax=Lactiplantibacillus herbarum TaxID=1670446 RepID=UPI00064EF53C|nr:hypothetical protein [Lactiplantibacillus herbarum]
MKQLVDRFGKEVWLGTAVVVIMLVGLFFYVSNKKTNIASQVKITYSGHNGTGSASVKNDTALRREIIKTDAAKAKLSQYYTNQLLDNVDNLDDYLDEVTTKLSSANREEMAQTITWILETEYHVKPNSDLHNGDKVKFVVTNHTDKSNPIKATSKTFKVSGLD